MMRLSTAVLLLLFVAGVEGGCPMPLPCDPTCNKTDDHHNFTKVIKCRPGKESTVTLDYNLCEKSLGNTTVQSGHCKITNIVQCQPYPPLACENVTVSCEKPTNCLISKESFGWCYGTINPCKQL
eukprot:Hpha_TRINITY_DN11625_c0_g1::TRINITY_DN11625_c0_g1_i2::g.49399::m.49399